MALRLEMLKATAFNKGCGLGLLRCVHVVAMPPPSIHSPIVPPHMVLPESEHNPDNGRDKYNNNIGFGLPSFAFNGSMELMAVPKRKTTPHKRGIRNGPKALKPIPVIIRCRCCGRVKLPHFYCCSGDRGKPGEQNN